jgi:hypothetical protein
MPRKRLRNYSTVKEDPNLKQKRYCIKPGLYDTFLGMMHITSMPWTAEQVLALAPDASSANSGKGLATPRKWKMLGASDACAWGAIQGSGKDPYQTSIDFSGPAFRCSCPSRKFPCKHGLGLFLIFAQQPAAMTEKTPPAWTTEWLAKRLEKEEKKSTEITAPDVPPDPAAVEKAAVAAAKRMESREAKVTAGLDELGVWLEDLIRSGFAILPGKPASFWDNPAARLVDAQAPGLARRVRKLDRITTLGERWPAMLLRETALLQLVKEGWSRMAALPEATQADLRAVIGFTADQEEVLAQTAVRDHWMVVAQRIEEDEHLRTQWTWMFGQNTKRPALSLSFSAGPNQPLDMSLKPGTAIEAELAFFPSAWPLRALVKQCYRTLESPVAPWRHQTIAEANAFAAEAFAATPWIERMAFAFESVTPVRRPQGWIIRDEPGNALGLEVTEAKAWVVYSLSGGQPVSLAGEWDGESFTPLSVRAEGRFLRL